MNAKNLPNVSTNIIGSPTASLFMVKIIVASEASDPIFKTIHFQYYTLVVLIQIKYFCKSEEGVGGEEISRGGNSS